MLLRTNATDSGLYFCIGKTNEALSTPGFLHLTVLAADEAITEAPSNVTATAGDDVALTCRTHLELHRHMSWVRLLEDAIVELAQGGGISIDILASTASKHLLTAFLKQFFDEF